jgi:hypothetical protein
MIEKQWFGCFVSWSPELWLQKTACIKPTSPQPSSRQKPVSLMTQSPLIPSKATPIHSWEVSRAVVMIEKQWFGCYCQLVS